MKPRAPKSKAKAAKAKAALQPQHGRRSISSALLRRSDSRQPTADVASEAALRDVHMEPELRKLALDRAGVSDLRYPICVLDRARGQQHTIAAIDMSVSVPHRRRGAHMSRFIELLNRHRREIDIRKFRALCSELLREMDAEAARVEVRFPYFIEKAAPVSGAVGLVDYACTFGASVAAARGKGGRETADLWVEVEVPVTSLCPCSKAISKHGAHNQRSLVRARVWFKRFFWIEDLIKLVEASASSELYSLLKRPDEKFVTERAYEHPRFVEDLVREVGTRLRASSNFPRWEVGATSFESIHTHNAYAQLSWPKGG
jgi:GTP cyclohydrolase I